MLIRREWPDLLRSKYGSSLDLQTLKLPHFLSRPFRALNYPSMSLLSVWEDASASPYSPTIPKDHQFYVAGNLLLLGMMLYCH